MKAVTGAAAGLVVLAAPALVLALASTETPPATTPAGERGVVAPDGGRANSNKGGASKPDTPAPSVADTGGDSKATPNGPPPEAGPNVTEFSCDGPPPFAGHPARDGVDRSAQAHEFNEWRKANCPTDEPATNEQPTGTPPEDVRHGKPDGTPGKPAETPGPPDGVPNGKPAGTPGTTTTTTGG
jgi:hypothetical protein